MADEHGKFQSRPEAEELFGVDRSQSTRTPVEFSLESWGNCSLRYGEGKLLAQGAQAMENAPDGTPILLEHSLGQGRVLLLNLLLTGYQEVLLGGVGGELLSTRGGNEDFCQKIREWLDRALQRAGTAPRVAALLADSQTLYPAHTTLRQDGDAFVFGMVKPVADNGTDKYPMLFQDTPQESVTVTLPVAGFLYDVRKGAFLGEGNSFSTRLVPGDAALVSILPQKAEEVFLQAPASAQPGAPLEIVAQLKDATTPQVFRLELTDPAGKAQEIYQQVKRGEEGTVQFSFAFALNDPKGIWKITAHSVNTGLERSVDLLLE